MWEDFLRNINFNDLNVDKQIADREHYTKYEQIRNLLRNEIASYLVNNLELLKNFNYKLNSHPNQPQWDPEGKFLRLYFYKGYKTQGNLQINVELNPSNISFFIYDSHNNYFKSFENEELISLIESTTDIKMTTYDGDQRFKEKLWIGLYYDKNKPPNDTQFLKIIEALVILYHKIIEGITMKQKVNLINYNQQLILYGPPGTGKTHEAKKIASQIVTGYQHKSDSKFDESHFNAINSSNQENIKGYWQIIQFHPSYNYEDFVRGVQVETVNESISYKTVDRIFAQMCKNAQKGQDYNKYVLIIDEINRANLAAVLGELIYALEYRDEPVQTPYTVEEDHSSSITVPSNLYIIGTMNTADRSIGHIDYAVRRRFAFVPILPDQSLLSEKGKILFTSVEKLFKGDHSCLSLDFHADDVQPGHTYFMVKDNENQNEDEILAIKFAYQVYPLLREYYKDGVLVQNENDIKITINGKEEIQINLPEEPDDIVEKVKRAISY